MTDIYKTIEEDHGKHRGLLGAIGETSGDSAERRRLWNQFYYEVKSHAAAEEETAEGFAEAFPLEELEICSDVVVGSSRQLVSTVPHVRGLGLEALAAGCAEALVAAALVAAERALSEAVRARVPSRERAR
mgnify:CR=1 FL=1